MVEAVVVEEGGKEVVEDSAEVEVVEVVNWVPSTHRPWTDPATSTINMDRKPGVVLTGTTVQ